LSYRDDSLDARHPLRVMLGEVASGLALTRVALAPLSLEAVAQLAEPYGVDAGELYRVSAGNPFFVTEVCAAGNSGIPATVRDSVLARAARLSSEARTLLEAVAIVPLQVELWLLEMLTGEHLTALEECLSSGMLVEGAAGSVAFRHELARLAIEELIEPRRRLSFHRAALAALAEPPEGVADPARLAHHADAAGDAGAVLRFAPAAAEQAAALGAHREAADQYARALRYGDHLTPGERGDLLRKQAIACHKTDQYDDSLAAATRATDEYQSIGDRLREGDALRIRSDADRSAGYIAECRQDALEAISLLETVPVSRELAHAYANLSSLHLETEQRREAKAWAARAIELGQKLGANDVVIRATTDIGTAEVFEGAPEGPARLEDLLASAGEAGMVDQVGRIYTYLLWPAMTVRNYTITEKHLAPGLQYCSDHGLELEWLYLRAYAARVDLDTGRWDDAAEHATAVLRVPRRSTMIRILALVVLALVRARRGDPEVRALLDEAWALGDQSDELPRIGPPRSRGPRLHGCSGGRTRSSRRPTPLSISPSAASRRGGSASSSPGADEPASTTRLRWSRAARLRPRSSVTGARRPGNGRRSAAHTKRRSRWPTRTRRSHSDRRSQSFSGWRPLRRRRLSRGACARSASATSAVARDLRLARIPPG
jgi:tetratricopeptide (TPR) repeat protein